MPRVIAHRGASKLERENTLQAFRTAAQLGSDAVELDVRKTVDDFLVIHHDPHLPDGRLIRATRVADLPEHVPSLAAALDACEGMWVNVEIKNDPSEPDFDPFDAIADATVAHLVERGAPERWLISAFRWEVIDRCRALAPEIRTAFLCERAPEGIARKLAVAGHAALHPWFGKVTEELIAACHAEGVQVNVWTCDDPTWMVRLAGWHVDGICTNVPDLALATLGRRDDLS